MKDIDPINSKLDTVLSVLNDDKFKIFNPELGNMMTCYFESFFDMEDFMKNYGITGKNVTSNIFSYLDFKSMLAARMVLHNSSRIPVGILVWEGGDFAYLRHISANKLQASQLVQKTLMFC